MGKGKLEGGCQRYKFPDIKYKVMAVANTVIGHIGTV